MAKQGPSLIEVAADRGDDFGRLYVGELRPSRDEVLTEHGMGDLELYEKLLGDEQVYATFFQRRADVIAREWKVEPGGSDAIDVMASDSLRDQLNALSWDRTSYRMLGGLFYGFSLGECMFGTDGAKYYLDAVRVRRSRRFGFAMDGTLRLMRAAMPAGEVMPEQKFWRMTCNADDDDNPHGIGLGRWVYWPSWFKRNVIQFWSIFLEEASRPTPVAKHPRGMKDTEKRLLSAALKVFRGGGQLMVSDNVAVDFPQLVRDAGGSYEAFVARMDSAIAKVILTQTMSTESATAGLGSGQAEVQERKGNIVAKGDADLLCESFMLGPAKWLTEWNYPGAKVPKVYRDFSEAQNLKALAEQDESIARLGYRPTAKRIVEVYGEGYEPAAATPTQAPAAFAETTEARAVERVVGEAGWRRVIGPEVSAIGKALDGAKDLKGAKSALAKLATEEPTAELVETLARTNFVSRVVARATDEADEE